MAKNFSPLKELPRSTGFKKDDVIVLFGELFGKGYANGIVEFAKEKGLKLIGTTVGRRDSDGTLRPLNSDELSAAKSLAPFDHFINVPLEAGFDLEKADGVSPCDQLQGLKMDQWDKTSLDWKKINASVEMGRARFKKNTAAVIQEIQKWAEPKASILFVHTMAGGIPRAKILMPTMNKVFKGRGDRFISSEDFWKSELGKLSALSFREVTAETFRHLIDESQSIRTQGRHVSYVAYGYHGCEILMDGKYTWQSYSPYLQGWAKVDLEAIAEEKWALNIKCTVFNCPEILTNSSNLFQGVELPLYPFLAALKKEQPNKSVTVDSWKKCQDLLKEENSVESVLKYSNEVMTSSFWSGWCDYETWPQHSGSSQMDSMLNASDKLIDMHKDPKNTLALDLSRLIFKSTGRLMFDEGYWSSKPVWWLGHDILAKAL